MVVPMQAKVVGKKKEWIGSCEVEKKEGFIRERKEPDLC